MTIVTAVIAGIIYPLVMTGVAQVLFPRQGQRQLGQGGRPCDRFDADRPGLHGGRSYFQPRPSAAGTGYDAMASSASNLGPTSKTLAERVAAAVAAGDRGEPGAAARRGAHRHGDDLRQRARPRHHRGERPGAGTARRRSPPYDTGRPCLRSSRSTPPGVSSGSWASRASTCCELNLALDEGTGTPRSVTPDDEKRPPATDEDAPVVAEGLRPQDASASAAATRSSWATRRASARPTPCLPRPGAGSSAAKTSSIGFVETHGREAIAELAEGLPVIPRKSIEYRGKTLRGDGHGRRHRAAAGRRAGRRAGPHQRPGHAPTRSAGRASRRSWRPASTSSRRSTSSTSRA